jgi:4-hydroxy-tetrahydrodipicolinate synthase
MDRTSVDWEGYFLAMITPFTADGALDEQGFRDVIDIAIDNEVDGIVPVGCTGEWWALTDAERVRLYEITAQHTAGRVPTIVGTAAFSTRKAIEMTQAAKDAGCDAAMLTAPPYALPLEREIVTFFQRISDAVDFPIVLYNNPNRVRRALTPEIVDKLADIENVVAIKDSSGDIDMQLKTLEVCKDRIRYFQGGTKNAHRLVPAGSLGFVDSAIAHVSGNQGSRFYRELRDGNIDAALELVPSEWAVELHDLFWGEAGMFPASLKEAMVLVGRPGGPPRDPLLPITDEEREVLKKRLAELGIAVTAVA